MIYVPRQTVSIYGPGAYLAYRELSSVVAEQAVDAIDAGDAEFSAATSYASGPIDRHLEVAYAYPRDAATFYSYDGAWHDSAGIAVDAFAGRMFDAAHNLLATGFCAPVVVDAASL